MPSVNNTSSTNNINQVCYNMSTTIEYLTDRAVTGVALHGVIERLQGLGNTVPSLTSIFTNKTS